MAAVLDGVVTGGVPARRVRQGGVSPRPVRWLRGLSLSVVGAVVVVVSVVAPRVSAGLAAGWRSARRVGLTLGAAGSFTAAGFLVSSVAGFVTLGVMLVVLDVLRSDGGGA